ncbi:MAG TPA: LCP family protein [Anaerolineae bacterium]|nr:LCP family protein [Anaerolineae bacterium]
MSKLVHMLTKGSKWRRVITGGLIILFVIVTIWIYQTAQTIGAEMEIIEPNFSGVVEPTLPTPLPLPPGTIVAEETRAGTDVESEGDIIVEEDEGWSDYERITILFLGIDQRCDEDGPTRTDSMMVVTIDPIGGTAAVLSLPRDLWVEIPGIGVDRINQAHYYGEAYEYPGGGGPALARETVAATLGIKIDYYITVNFDAFTEVVDLIGGIDIEVPETIDDPDYPDNCYGFDPFYIEEGEHRLNGALALKYARTRATFGGDVDRAERQQQVVLAVRDRVTQLGILPQLMGQSSDLWASLQKNVRTNMTLDTMIQLGLLVPEIPRDNIRTVVIDYQYVYGEITPEGQQVLVPIRENIRALREEMFAPPAVPTPVLDDELPQRVVAEGARVVIYNGTPVFGLAGQTEAYLTSLGINVVDIGNADAATYPATQLIAYDDYPETIFYLSQVMSIRPLNIKNDTMPGGDFDILIILGNDWELPAD